MVLTFDSRFVTMSLSEYIEITKQFRGIWLMKLTDQNLIGLFQQLGLKAKQCEIDGSYEEWHEFYESCYTVWYKDKITGKQTRWESPTAQNYSLRELAEKMECIHENDFIRKGEFEQHNIITAYDQERDLRLLVDGIHRASILTMETVRHSKPPFAQIYELRGSRIDQVFVCDFLHF